MLYLYMNGVNQPFSVISDRSLMVCLGFIFFVHDCHRYSSNVVWIAWRGLYTASRLTWYTYYWRRNVSIIRRESVFPEEYNSWYHLSIFVLNVVFFMYRENEGISSGGKIWNLIGLCVFIISTSWLTPIFNCNIK